MKRKRRRGNGEDTVFEDRKNKRWIGQYISGMTEEGKPIRKSVYAKTQKEVLEKLNDARYKLNNDIYIDKNNIELVKIMEDIREEKLASNTISEGQYARLGWTIKKIKESKLGKARIQEITKEDIQKFLNSIKHLSDSYIKKVYEQFVQAYKRAEIKKCISYNPMYEVVKPKSSKQTKIVEALDIEIQKQFTDYLMKSSIEEEKYKNIFLIQMYMGLRVGEVLALSSDNIDLENKMVYVRKTLANDKEFKVILSDKTKTYSGKRDLPIPEFLPITYKGRTLLAVKINEIPQNKKPCYYKNAGMHKGSYIRIGDSDEPMTEYEIYSLQSYNDGIQEDLRPIKRANIDDLDKEKINEYIEKIKENKPNFSKFSNEKILKLSGIIENSTGEIYPTLAGTLLFAEYPQAYLPQLVVACVVVPGTQWGDIGEMGQRFDDNKKIEGTLDEMLEQTLSFIRKNIGTKIIIDSNGKRENLPEYPMKALREAVANALVHRDYSISRESAYIYVQIYDDRIEILNPGDLYGNNRLENLGTDMILEARNKNIVRLLEEKGNIIENRHTGIATIKKEMQKMGLPEPEFKSLRGDFKVILRKEKTETGIQNKTESGQKWTEENRSVN